MPKKNAAEVPLYLGLVEHRGESWVVPFLTFSDMEEHNKNEPLSKVFEWNSRDGVWMETEL